jgi:hypothetical protein
VATSPVAAPLHTSGYDDFNGGKNANISTGFEIRPREGLFAKLSVFGSTSGVGCERFGEEWGFVIGGLGIRFVSPPLCRTERISKVVL